jgi:GNAT superfamily N-acetyltransferase
VNIQIRPINEREEALALAPFLERSVRASHEDWREEDLPEETMLRFLERRFGDPCCLLLVAQPEDGEPLGACVTAPFEDPLTGETVPMIVLLFVLPAARRQGLARALVRQARRVLAGRGQDTVVARAPYNDDVFISMGERWGFVRAWELMVREG